MESQTLGKQEEREKKKNNDADNDIHTEKSRCDRCDCHDGECVRVDSPAVYMHI